jgi:ubiquinone/menaquinone biosynthesis C-methylase UbiE
MELQPDQRPSLWDDHVCAYETVFEPLTSAFAAEAIARLRIAAHERVIDVAAGCGGTALMLARRDADVLAVDASWGMAQRARVRLAAARAGQPGNDAVAVMDGIALAVADASMDAALSVFGVVLFPDAVAGVAEIVRVLRPHGRAALVTWTEPEHYELMSELIGAVRRVIPHFPMPADPPAQLRYRDEATFRTLLAHGGLRKVAIDRVTATLELPSARWLGSRIAFAPGMEALIARLGPGRDAVIAEFVRGLELRHREQSLSLGAVAYVGVGWKDGG